MPEPPLGFPSQIQILNVLPGNFASSSGGGIATGHGQATVRIDGDPANLFSVVSVETQRLVRDPELPPGSPRTWQTISVVNGAGPVAVGVGTALLVTVGFTAPVGPGPSTFNATASAVTDDATPLTVLKIPLDATLTAGALTIAAVTLPVMLAGQTSNFEFSLTSTFQQEISGVLTCDSPDPLNPFSAATIVTASVPAAGSINVVLPILCSASVSAGSYPLNVRLTPLGGTDFGSARFVVTVTEGRTVSFFPSLSPNVTLPYLTPTLCEIRAVASGGRTTLNITAGSVPPGLILENVPQSLVLDGTAFFSVTITVDVPAPTETALAPLTLDWSIPEDTAHPAASGTISFAITTTTRNMMFGFQSFHVENCRSKGDHNDSDTLYITVSTPNATLPTQSILLGDNLHAGDTVLNHLVGPFAISDTLESAATFIVINATNGTTSPQTAFMITGDVLTAITGLDVGHFLGLAPSAIEAYLLGGVSGIFDALGKYLDEVDPPSDPDCSGSVLIRTVPYEKGQFAGGPQTFAPAVPESQPSPSVCGNGPHSTVVYLAMQVP